MKILFWQNCRNVFLKRSFFWGILKFFKYFFWSRRREFCQLVTSYAELLTSPGWILTALIVGVTGVSSLITWAVIRWHADVTRHPSIDSTQQTEQTFHFRKLSWEGFEKLKIPASQLLMKLANDKWLCVWLAFRSWELRSWAKSNGLPSIIIIIDCQEYKDLFHPSFGGKTVRNIALWSLIAAFKILWSLVDLYQHRALSIIIGWPVTRQAESSLIPFQLFTYRQLRQVLDFQHHLSSENFWWWLIECSFFKSCQSF